MNVCSIIPVTKFAKTTELAGAADGATWFQSARQRLDTAEPGAHAIDFDSVRIATVSWLREGPLALRKYAAAMRRDILLIVANLSQLVCEEIEVALDATGMVMIGAEVASDLEVLRPVLMGTLDPALKQTLRAVEGRAEFDASFISRALPGVGLSAANNRLAALEAKGTLKSERRGRNRVYCPVIEDLHYGYRNDREGYRQFRAKTTPMPGPT